MEIRPPIRPLASGFALLAVLALAAGPSRATAAPMPTHEATPKAPKGQPPPPCHPNRNAARDREAVRNRADVRHLPGPLRDRLAELATRPHSALPIEAFAEADSPSQLFWYFLLD